MSVETIEIEITPEGVASIEAFGFTGDGCKAATKAHEAIYKEEISSKDKPELHMGTKVSTKSNVSR
jgi:hypothetical protein